MNFADIDPILYPDERLIPDDILVPPDPEEGTSEEWADFFITSTADKGIVAGDPLFTLEVVKEAQAWGLSDSRKQCIFRQLKKKEVLGDTRPRPQEIYRSLGGAEMLREHVIQSTKRPPAEISSLSMLVNQLKDMRDERMIRQGIVRSIILASAYRRPPPPEDHRTHQPHDD